MSDMIERVARAIAAELGDDLDNAFETKSDWIRDRGEKGGRFRDINEPFRDDYFDAARAAMDTIREDVCRAMVEALCEDGDVRLPYARGAFDAALGRTG